MLLPASDYGVQDRRGTIAALEPWWEELVLGLDPAPVADLLEEGRRLLASDVPDEELIDRSMALLQAAGRRLAAAGAFGTATGVVHGLFTSAGGVPKLPVDEASVTVRGLAGDRQRTRKHHGRPWQALCLWAKEKVDLLAAEGHPIHPGAAGENISVEGVPWELVRPGVRLRIGDVLAECSLYALPCAKNRGWFADRRPMRMHHRTELGISRMYASVLEPGHIRLGDPVTLEP